MTEEEKRDIVQEVLKAIKAQLQDIMSLPSSENVSEFKSLPRCIHRRDVENDERCTIKRRQRRTG